MEAHPGLHVTPRRGSHATSLQSVEMLMPNSSIARGRSSLLHDKPCLPGLAK